MRLVLVALFSILSLVASAQFKLYEQGIDAYQAKEYPKAISLLNEYLDKGTRDKAFDVEVRYYVALAYFKTQYFTSSVREFDKALQLGHKNVGNINWFMAKAYSELKAYRESIECYTKAIEIIKDPANQSKLYFERAIQYEKQGSSALVATDLKQSITLDKNNGEAATLLKRVTPANDARGLVSTPASKETQKIVSTNSDQPKELIPVVKNAAKESSAVVALPPPTSQAKPDVKNATTTKQVTDQPAPVVASNEVTKPKLVDPISTTVDTKSNLKKPDAGTTVVATKIDATKAVPTTTEPPPLVNKKAEERQIATNLPASSPVATPVAPTPTPVVVPAEPTLADEYKDEKRYALIIGNSKYKFVQQLKNATNDANDMAVELGNSGFEVIKVIDGDYMQMREAFRKFNEQLNKGPKDQTVGLFYYAGHGMQNEGENYLIPIDADVKDDIDIPRVCLPMQRVVLANMERSSTRMNIVIMDACRNNPFPSSSRSAGGSGLAEIKRAKGSFIAYATAPGSTASDGEGRNGLYTQELLKAMKKPNRTIESVFKEVRANVLKLSDDRQNTWDSSNIIGDFYFKF